MAILYRYLQKLIGYRILITWFGLTGIITVIEWMLQLPSTTAHYTIDKTLLYCLHLLPRNAYDMFLPSSILGVFLAFNHMQRSRELLIASICGINQKILLRKILAIIIAWVAIAVFVGEVLAPSMTQKAKVLKRIKHQDATSFIHTMWWKEGNAIYKGFYRNDPYHISPLYRFTLKHDAISDIDISRYVSFSDGKWYLHHTQTTNISHNKINHHTDNQPHIWHTRLKPSMLKLNEKHFDKLNLIDLLKGYLLRKRGLTLIDKSIEQAYLQRLIFPLNCIMILAALSFLCIQPSVPIAYVSKPMGQWALSSMILFLPNMIQGLLDWSYLSIQLICLTLSVSTFIGFHHERITHV